MPDKSVAVVRPLPAAPTLSYQIDVAAHADRSWKGPMLSCRMQISLTATVFMLFFVQPQFVCAETSANGIGAPAPEKTDDGWETGTLQSEGVDPRPIGEMFSRIRDGSYKNIHGVVIVRNGKLIAEEYYPAATKRGSTRCSIATGFMK